MLSAYKRMEKPAKKPTKTTNSPQLSAFLKENALAARFPFAALELWAGWLDWESPPKPEKSSVLVASAASPVRDAVPEGVAVAECEVMVLVF